MNEIVSQVVLVQVACALKLPSRYVLRRTAVVTLIAATISISVSTGIRILIGAQADLVTIIVRLVLPFLIAIPLGLIWFSRMERLDHAYRDLMKRTTELARRASTDPLTGLLNRRSFAEQFDLALSHGVKGGFLIADVDYLKPINDRHGHLVGDEAIVSAGIALREVLGDSSLVARIGGDEFCGFVPLERSGDPEQLFVRICKRAAREFRERTGLAEPELSLSCGFALCRQGQTFRDMIAQTDDSLYSRKRQRRPRAAA